MKQLIPPPIRSFLGLARYALGQGEPGFVRTKINGLREAFSSIFLKGNFRGRSYYADELLKSSARIALEQVYYALKYYTTASSVTEMYFAFGLDRKSANAGEFVFLAEGMKHTHLLNSFPYDQLPLLQNKLVAKAYLREQGIRAPFDYGVLYLRDMRWILKKGKTETDFQEWAFAEPRHLFCKLLDGECGRGAFSLDTEPEGCRVIVDGVELTWEEFRRDLDGVIILEERLLQHPALMELHPQSLNTIRVVTFKGSMEERPVIMHCVLRIGVGNNTVDNWAHGGLAVGINSSGRLMPYGYYKPMFKPAGVGRLTEHPDTHVIFAGREIPFFREVEELALQAHEAFGSCTTVGWDIAVLEEGPAFIEGNTDWDIEFSQVPLGGWRPLMEKYLLPVRRRMKSQRLYALMRTRRRF